MTGNREDIDINDPNFWQKWAKKADLDTDELKNKVTNSSVDCNIEGAMQYQYCFWMFQTRKILLC